MKILFQYLSGGGGAVSNVILLLRAYARSHLGDQLVILCSEQSDLVSLRDVPNVEILTVRTRPGKEFKRLALGLYGLNQTARRIGADLIWSLNLGAYLPTTIPHVLSVHNSHQVYPTNAGMEHPRSAAAVSMLRFFFRCSLRSADAVIVQTPLMEEYVRRATTRSLPIKVIPKAVERSDDVRPSPLPDHIRMRIRPAPGEGKMNFLYVATLYPHKNHAVLVKSAELLAARGSRVRFVLTVSEHDLLRIGGEVAQRLISSGMLVPIGWTAKEHLKALYDACDACVMPSVLESLSSAHLEAMEWAKPQVAADLPYARDLCRDAAVYADPHDPTAWADSVDRLATDPVLRENLVKEGQRRMNDFPATWDSAASEVRQLFSTLI